MPQPVKPAKHVTNNSNRTIAIGATEIAPGSTARIPNYDRLRSAVVIIWEEQNIISVGAAERAVMPAAVPPQMPGAPVMPPMMPGSASGSVTVKNTSHGLAPSVFAACSSR